MKNISKALARFHAVMEPVEKDRDNPFFHSRYATLGQILNAIKEPLGEAGLTFTQIPTGTGLRTILMDVESGEAIEGLMDLMPVKNDPQAQGSALTYARRYAISAILGISTEEDDDGNAATHSQPTQQKICVECKKPHTGQYPKCLDCFKKTVVPTRP